MKKPSRPVIFLILLLLTVTLGSCNSEYRRSNKACLKMVSGGLLKLSKGRVIQPGAC